VLLNVVRMWATPVAGALFLDLRDDDRCSMY
jgi:hypothetical protein